MKEWAPDQANRQSYLQLIMKVKLTIRSKSPEGESEKRQKNLLFSGQGPAKTVAELEAAGP